VLGIVEMKDVSDSAPGEKASSSGHSEHALRGDVSSSVLNAALRFSTRVRSLDTRARRDGRSLPTPVETQRIVSEFWRVLDLLRTREDADGTAAAAQRDVRSAVTPWLARSRYWARAIQQPHGYPGDFRLIEWVHELEDDPCLDPTQPAVANALDTLFASLNSVSGIWFRNK